MSGPTLGYYRVQGLAQPIRLLLSYAGVKFVDKHYPLGPNMEREEWLKDKPTLGLDFPNIPYYIDGSVKITQSLAILRHLGRKHGLVATDEPSLIRQDMVEQQVVDIRTAFIPIIIDKINFESNKVKYLSETLPPQLEALSKFLGTNQWFAGNRLTYVDFLVYQLLYWYRLLDAPSVTKHQNLVQFMDRFETIPQIKTYMKSPDYISWPLFGPAAAWGFYK